MQVILQETLTQLSQRQVQSWMCKNGLLRVHITLFNVIDSTLHLSVWSTAESTSLSGDSLGLSERDLTSRPRSDCAQSIRSVVTWAVPDDWRNPSLISDYCCTATQQATWQFSMLCCNVCAVVFKNKIRVQSLFWQRKQGMSELVGFNVPLDT